MIKRPDFIIISGNGRNTGKTTFVCEVIRRVSKDYPVTAIKVSPHFHEQQPQHPTIAGKGYTIRQENEQKGEKDSSRMLQSGANRVFYIEAKDDSLAEVINTLLPMIEKGHAVICESGGMRRWIEPSLLLLLNEAGREEKKPSYIKLLPLADASVTFSGDRFAPEPETVYFDGISWVLNTGS